MVQALYLGVWVQALPVPLCCVILDKSGLLSGLEFPHLCHLCHAVIHSFTLGGRGGAISYFCKSCLGQNCQVVDREGEN